MKSFLVRLVLMECLLFLYHIHRPTQVKEIRGSYSVEPEIAVEKNMKAYLLDAFKAPKIKDFLESRLSILINNDLILCCQPNNKNQGLFL